MCQLKVANPSTPPPPNACRSCRVRKLRCDRRTPCANCKAREITCEAQMLKRPYCQENQARDISSAIPRGTRRKVAPSTGDREQTRQPAVKPKALSPSPSPPLSAAQKASRADLERLQIVGAQEKFSSYNLSGGIYFTIRPSSLYETSDYAPYPSDCSTPSVDGAAKEICLPLKKEALVLFEHYINHAQHVHYIHHPPSARALLDDVYTSISNQQPTAPGHVSLVLSILAASAYSLASIFTGIHFFPSLEAAIAASVSWTQAALDVLEHSRRSQSGSLEDVQSLIILLFLLYNLEGFSVRVRVLNSIALTIARDLSMHTIDSRDSKKDAARLSKEAEIELEVKRRVWWHLVGTDWILALASGPQQGTYWVNPRHMTVNEPRNVNQDDLEKQASEFSRPLSEPTSMSYFIQRVRLAKICQRVVDKIPLGIPDRDKTDYADVIAVDNDFGNFQLELPFFFRLDKESQDMSHSINSEFPYIALQRYILSIQFHARRCRLHQPFLIFGTLEPPYHYSREVCLDAARSVIQTMRLIQKEESPFVSSFQRFYGVVHGVFMATIVLMMDLCINKIPGQEEQRKSEILEACNILEKSPTAGRVLRYLRDILHRHNAAPLGLDASQVGDPQIAEGSAAKQGSVPRAVDSQIPGRMDSRWDVSGPEYINGETSFFNEIWANSYAEDLFSWDTLFSDLDDAYPLRIF